MATRFRWVLFTATLFSTVLYVATRVHAAEPEFDAASRAEIIAPFVDDQTIAILHVNLASVNFDALLDKMAELVPEMAADVQETRERTKQMQTMVGAGMTEFFVLMRISDLPNRQPLVIVPTDQTDADKLRKVFPVREKEGLEKIHGVWCYGPSDTLEHAKTAQVENRPEITDALNAAGDTLAQLIIVPPKYSIRVIEEMMPELPKEVGGGPSSILTRGVLWIAVGANAPPNTSFKVVVQSKDAEAATVLRDKWLHFIQFLGTYEKARETLRNFRKVAQLLTPTVSDNQLVLNLNENDGSINALLSALTPPLDVARARARRQASVNNLKQLALAMHNYHDSWKSFPAVGNSDPSGKMLLSWRVHILPFIEQNKLYQQFHLNEPWDSEHNKKLIAKMPVVYHCPASKLAREKGLSTYRVVSAEGTVFPGREGIRIRDIIDGTSNTIMITEVTDENAVIWTKPEGFPFDPKNPGRGLGGHFKGGFNAAWCDGSVRFIAHSIDKKILLLLFLRNDRQPIPDF